MSIQAHSDGMKVACCFYQGLCVHAGRIDGVQRLHCAGVLYIQSPAKALWRFTLLHKAAGSVSRGNFARTEVYEGHLQIELATGGSNTCSAIRLRSNESDC